MMPAFCPDDVSPGEKAVYTAFRESGETDNWVVLHSLGIADHVRQVEGEADFVVIIPNTGILIIEVKSHQSIDRRADGSWKLGNDAPTARGPFQQASEAMHSLRAYLRQKRVDLRSVPMLSAVWFTGVRARTMLPPNPEWHDWQVLDSEDLKAAPAAVVRTLTAGTKHLDGKIKYFSYGGVGPDGETADRVARLLRPKFELATVAGDRRRAHKTQLVSFIEEQFLALDAVAENRSVLFAGPAGTGKTFLAMESARREVATGKQGRLLCFNRFLGKRLVADMADLDGLTVGTFHQELLRLAGLHHAPNNPTRGFWREELPERALETLINSGPASANDFLIVDEIQDIATEQYLDVLDLMVDGGLKDGRVLLFGDFERQAIFENETGRERLRARTPHLTSHKLIHNCRNLPRIGYQVNLLCDLQPGYQRFRRPDDGIDPTFRQYRAGQDQSALLAAAIRELRNEGYELNEIVVLSPHRDYSTAATTNEQWLRQILKAADGLPARPGQVQYSTIHAFKGLEAPAVVVTDLDRQVAAIENFDSLLYIGLTRATDRLIALIETNTLRKAVGGTA
ncbi:nuclease-related domain-containing DEAD/DEAH box helicase [Lentzea aerocolonigenes]|uniref:nuclease-related domain-containing DEAD/DEAH box helicase n=1 Tax=Lentzea aerocolonigenes TaxID=68170 RepID=UPI0004C47129|nr:NERD domain-containing protein/DEAD/DEAH box helicase [Lentzea aerocolonigenes]MCP2242439.1 AAA domain-containing protein [Lentzea aerocolonigenes]